MSGCIEVGSTRNPNWNWNNFRFLGSTINFVVPLRLSKSCGDKANKCSTFEAIERHFVMGRAKVFLASDTLGAIMWNVFSNWKNMPSIINIIILCIGSCWQQITAINLNTVRCFDFACARHFERKRCAFHESSLCCSYSHFWNYGVRFTANYPHFFLLIFLVTLREKKNRLVFARKWSFIDWINGEHEKCAMGKARENKKRAQNWFDLFEAKKINKWSYLCMVRIFVKWTRPNQPEFLNF